MSLNTTDDRMLLAVVEEPGGLFSAAIVRQIFESTRAFTFDIFAFDRREPQGETPLVFQSPTLLIDALLPKTCAAVCATEHFETNIYLMFSLSSSCKILHDCAVFRCCRVWFMICCYGSSKTLARGGGMKVLLMMLKQFCP